RVAVIGSATLPSNAETLRETELAAGALGVKLQFVDVLSPKDIEADSLARPGGNITGIATLSRELSGKRLALVKEGVPKMSRVAILRDADSEGAAIGFKEYEVAALALKIPLQSLEVRGPSPDFEGAFRAAAK